MILLEGWVRIMLILYLVLVVTSVWSLPTELKECEYCRNNSARCEVGHVLKNNCIQCQCSKEYLYQCEPVSPPCNEGEENIILGKPTKARCEPYMVYERDSVICMCNKGGYWPHEKCEVTFKSLYNPENRHQSPQVEEPLIIVEKCSPNSYLIQDCNVCRCSAEGAIARCTQNDCTKKVVIRRNYDNVHGSCIPNNWYSLAPCQFCHCQQSNKLVCSTRTKDFRSLKLGAYNLTDCGKELVKELYELAPEGPANLLRDGAMTLSSHFPSTTTTKAPSTKHKPLQSGRLRTAMVPKPRPYDANLELSFNLNKPVQATASPDEYESEEETVTEGLRISGKPTFNLLDNDDSASVEEKKPSSYVRLSDGSYKPVYDEQESLLLRIPNSSPPQQKSLQEALLAKGLPKEMVQILTSMPEVSRMRDLDIEVEQGPAQPVQNYDFSINTGQSQPHVLRINLPSVLDSIIKMALRKSMVKIDNSQNCMPGTTTQEGCNFCYCLTNGKLLCTTKKTC